VDEIPEGKNWQYEPKWDGFRCLIFRFHGRKGAAQAQRHTSTTQNGRL
jgi:ATP-dependent DNA ligase